MIPCVSSVIDKNLTFIGPIDSVRKAWETIVENRARCLLVLEESNLVGIVTRSDIINSHPNRIVADAMKYPVISASSNTSLWLAKERLENNNIGKLVIIDNGIISGIAAKDVIWAELGKYIDSLTGLYKSQYIYYRGVEYIQNGCEISVIFIDVNDFGKIDKKIGHYQGDLVLQKIGSLLKEYTPRDACVCRFGGDEFLVLAPYTADRCLMLARQYAQAFELTNFHNEIEVSVSMGIAGGRRYSTRKGSALKVITDLINLASLASTKGKKKASGITVSHDLVI